MIESAATLSVKRQVSSKYYGKPGLKHIVKKTEETMNQMQHHIEPLKKKTKKKINALIKNIDVPPVS